MAKQQIDVFDSVYWFNQGIEACNNNKFRESLECFLFSWRLYDGDIEALTNRILLIGKGRILMDGSPEELKQDAASMDEAVVKLYRSFDENEGR